MKNSKGLKNNKIIIIAARRLDLMILDKRRTYEIADFTIQTDHKAKRKESEKRDHYQDLTGEKMVHEDDGDINFNGNTRKNPLRL